MARHFVRGIRIFPSEMVVASRCYVELALRRSSPSERYRQILRDHSLPC